MQVAFDRAVAKKSVTDNYRIISQNMNMRGSVVEYDVVERTMMSLLALNPAILVLNEVSSQSVNYVTYILENKRFTAHASKVGRNLVVVGIKDGEGLSVIDVEELVQSRDTPDFLSVLIENRAGELFRVVGVRVKIRPYGSREARGALAASREDTSRAKQFKELMKYLEALEEDRIIVIGDFNLARRIGSRDLDYDTAMIGYQDKAQKRHNYHKAKHELERLGINPEVADGETDRTRDYVFSRGVKLDSVQLIGNPYFGARVGLLDHHTLIMKAKF